MTQLLTAQNETTETHTCKSPKLEQAWQWQNDTAMPLLVSKKTQKNKQKKSKIEYASLQEVQNIILFLPFCLKREVCHLNRSPLIFVALLQSMHLLWHKRLQSLLRNFLPNTDQDNVTLQMSEENHLHSWVKAEWREKQTLVLKI